VVDDVQGGLSAVLPLGMVAAGDEVLSRLLSPPYLADPHPLYAWMRDNDPVHRTGLGQCVLARHADVMAVLRHPGFGRPPMPALPFEALQVLVKMFLLLDPPDHTRQRSAVSRFFTPAAIEAWRPRVSAIVAELLDRIAEAEEFDLIAELAYPLPVRVISEMLRVPEEDRERFTRWSRALVGLLDPSLIEPADVLNALGAAEELVAYAGELAADRRRRPVPDDLLSALVAAVDAGQLSEEEMVSICVLLLIAGHETTVNLIGNGTLSLLRHPEELARLRADPALIRTAVEELARYEPPVPIAARMAHEDVELADTVIREGELAVVVLAAANRDPTAFDDPECLDLARSPNPHVSFGHGIHFCLGAPLARLESQVALHATLGRFPGLELGSDELHWRNSLALRGLVSLPLTRGRPAGRPRKT